MKVWKRRTRLANTKATAAHLGPREPGPHGLTLTTRYSGRTRPIEPRETRERDRSLHGKARVRARRAGQR